MAVINPDEISSILKENIRNYEAKAEISILAAYLKLVTVLQEYTVCAM